LSESPGIEVVGIARDGLEALEKVAELAPDVLTLDLVMPNLDGLGVLQGLPAVGAPRVVVVSISDADTDLGAAALQAGAVDIVRKPTALATAQLYELRDELTQKIRLAAAARSSPPPGQTAPLSSPLLGVSRHAVLVIGASTGGPQAISRILRELPANLPVPVAVALHIPSGYTEALAARLDTQCAIDVREASDGLELRPGLAVIARGGAHMKLVAGGARTRVVVLDHSQDASAHAPSVDLLFTSAAERFGAATLGVVLTGMGDDGTRGAAAIRQAGGAVLTESERSCVVYGMPRSVKEAGHSTAEVPLEAMTAEILRQLR
jgi:two-component system chemotaxis response regulator CheB